MLTMCIGMVLKAAVAKLRSASASKWVHFALHPGKEVRG